jgi:uncharacterized protein (TIGR02271 family)
MVASNNATTTVVGLFDDHATAEKVVRALQSAGFDRDDIGLTTRQQDESGEYVYDKDQVPNPHAGDTEAPEGAGAGATAGTVLGGLGGLLAGLGLLAVPGIGVIAAAGPLGVALTTAAGAGIGAASGGLIGGLVGLGIPEEHAHYYAEGIRRGGTLVTVGATDANYASAVEVMRNHGAADINQRGAYYKSQGFEKFESGDMSTYDESKFERFDKSHVETDRKQFSEAEAGGKLPVIEEEVTIGKEKVKTGGVRIYNRVIETPVSEQVNLRSEHVEVERRPVDRAVTGDDMKAFKDGEVTLTETAERAVVNKEARVTEEVVVGKDVDVQTETVTETARGTEVEVERIEGETTTTKR